MLEHELPNNEAAILRVALDIANDRDVLKGLLSRAHMELEAAQAESLCEICRLDSVLWQTADECAALASDLDDMQAEWAATQMNANRMDAVIFRQMTSITALQIEKSNLTIEAGRSDALRARIAELEAALAEANRQKVAAFERNAELERKIAEAVNALRNASGDFQFVDSGAARLIADRLDGPRAPTVPRRDTPGIEVNV